MLFRSPGYDGSSVVYFLKYQASPIDIQLHPTPHEFKGFGVFSPPHVTTRIQAQSGIFTIQDNPRIPVENYLDPQQITKLRIPFSLRYEFRRILHCYGIHQASLFPGLDGLASHLEKMQRDEY